MVRSAGGLDDAAATYEGPLEPEVLERLRRSGFRIDRDGEFQHEGEPVRHEGLRRALFRWLDSLPDGRVILRLDPQRFAYVDVDDTPLVAGAARLQEGRILIALSDGAEEPLDATSLSIDEVGIMRCSVRAGRLQARLATSAAAVIADLIEDGPQGPLLTLGGRAFPLQRYGETSASI